MARRSKKLMTETELNQLLQQRTAQATPKRQSSQVVEPDYENMGLAEFSGHVQATSQDCIKLGIDSGFKAAKAFERGNYTEGAVRTCEAGVGILTLVAIFARLWGAGSGRD